MWWEPTKTLYRSVNVDRVIILFGGGGDTWTLFWVIELVWTFCTKGKWGAKNEILHSGYCSGRFIVQWFSFFASWHAGNVYGVVILVAGGWDTWPLFCVIEVVWTFCTKKWMGAKTEILCSGQFPELGQFPERFGQFPELWTVSQALRTVSWALDSVPVWYSRGQIPSSNPEGKFQFFAPHHFLVPRVQTKVLTITKCSKCFGQLPDHPEQFSWVVILRANPTQ